MTYNQLDKYSLIVDSDCFGEMDRFYFQTYDGIIKHSKDSRIIFARGQKVEKILEWFTQREIKYKENLAKQEQASKDYLSTHQKRLLMLEEEDKKRRAWERDHWVCMEGGDGYFAP